MNWLNKTLSLLSEDVADIKELAKDYIVDSPTTLLAHGGENGITEFKGDLWCAREGSAIPESYAQSIEGSIYEFKCPKSKFFSLNDHKDKIQRTQQGHGISHTDKDLIEIIRGVLGDSVVEKYKKANASGRIFSSGSIMDIGQEGYPNVQKFKKFAQSLGCDGIVYTDEAQHKQSIDTAYILFDTITPKIKIEESYKL